MIGSSPNSYLLEIPSLEHQKQILSWQTTKDSDSSLIGRWKAFNGTTDGVVDDVVEGVINDIADSIADGVAVFVAEIDERGGDA